MDKVEPYHSMEDLETDLKSLQDKLEESIRQDRIKFRKQAALGIIGFSAYILLMAWAVSAISR